MKGTAQGVVLLRKWLLSMDAVEHKRPRKPTKKDSDRKFTMSVDKKGKPKITEVED